MTAIAVAAIALLLLEMLSVPAPYPSKYKGRRSEAEDQERMLVAASANRLIGSRTECLPVCNATKAATTVAAAG